MIKLFTPKQLKLSVEQFIRNASRDISKRSAMLQRTFLIPTNGEKSLRNFHENRATDKPFYGLGQITLLRAFPDPLGKCEAYHMYLISESVETMLHEMEYVDDPDDYLHIDNPYRGFESTESTELTKETDKNE